MTRVSFQEVYGALLKILCQLGFEAERARLCARLFAETSRDGVYSHGLNRFPLFVDTINRGHVDIHAEPKSFASFGALERWDGLQGPGNLNAHAAMERAIALAKEYGIGCVALRNTNHWMRGGSYGWQAAEAGVVGICWTNTLPNLPPWGGTEPRLGNNPLVIAVPRAEGHVVLDMALSQFSFGALEGYRRRGEKLPVVGGFDPEGKLTHEAGAIEASGRPLPIGYWKGSGLSLMLDSIAALVSEGNATYQINREVHNETALSQVFIALNLPGGREEMLDGIVGFLHSAAPSDGACVRYPGQRTLEVRRANMEAGIPVEARVWQQIQHLSG